LETLPAGDLSGAATLEKRGAPLLRQRPARAVFATGRSVVRSALGARAAVIATGDRHLLELDPYRGIRILAPAAVLELVNLREGGTDG